MKEISFSILFVCTGNAGRSQMAEALFRSHAREGLRVESAGVQPWQHLHPMAVKLLTERGLGIEGLYPKPVSAVAEQRFDMVVTIGDPARALLPRATFSDAYWIHWPIDDPADADGTPDSAGVFRATAQAIEGRLPALHALVARLPRIHAFGGKPGIGSGLWGREAFRPAQHLPLIQAAGFQAIELNLYRGPSHFDIAQPSAVRSLRQVADGLGLLVWSIHAPDVGDIAAEDPHIRQVEIDALSRCLAAAEQLGAKIVVSHALVFAGRHGGADGVEERIAAFLDAFAGQVEASPAQVAFENTFPSSTYGADTATLLSRLDQASRSAYGFALDTGHSNIEDDWGVVEGRVGDRLVHVHLNDNDGQTDAHLPPGSGTVDWGAVKRILNLAGYRGPTMYEIEPGAEDPTQVLKRTMAGHTQAHLDAAPGLGSLDNGPRVAG